MGPACNLMGQPRRQEGAPHSSAWLLSQLLPNMRHAGWLHEFPAAAVAGERVRAPNPPLAPCVSRNYGLFSTQQLDTMQHSCYNLVPNIPPSQTSPTANQEVDKAILGGQGTGFQGRPEVRNQGCSSRPGPSLTALPHFHFLWTTAFWV
jgi:hypothetical protein